MKDQTYGIAYLEGYFDARKEFLSKFDELAQALDDQAYKHAEAFVYEQDPKEKSRLQGLFTALGKASSDIWDLIYHQQDQNQ